MSAQTSRNTGVEVALRRELHRLGMRFRVHLRPLSSLRREADIVFTRAKVAVFVDGCFWHACDQHATWPKNNEQFWRTKIEKNRARDADTDQRLVEAGWASLRVWEHEDPPSAAIRVATVVQARRANKAAMQRG